MSIDSGRNQDIDRRGPEGEVMNDLSRRRAQRLQGESLVVVASNQMYGPEAFREEPVLSTTTEAGPAQQANVASEAEVMTTIVDPIELARYQVNNSHQRDIAA